MPFHHSILTSRNIFLVACLLNCLPVFLTTFPPMVDLPQHAGQISMLKAILNDQTPYKELFSIQWLTPYWLGYSLVLMLSLLVDTLTATKIIISLAIIAFPLSARAFLEAHEKNNIWSWLFIPLPYGLAFEWGFLNFMIAVPLGFLFLKTIIQNRDQRSTTQFVKIIIWCHILFLAHVLVMAFFLSIAAFILYHKNIKIWLKRIFPLFSVSPLFLIWFSSKVLNDKSNARGSWELGTHRIFEFIPSLFSVPDLIPYQVAGVAICLLPFICGFRIEPKIKHTAPFMLYFLLMIIGPHFILGTHYVYNRFSYIGLPLYFYMLKKKPYPTNKELKAHKYLAITTTISFCIFCIISNSLIALEYEKESEDYKKVLQEAEPNKRVLSLTLLRDSHFYKAPVYLHYPVWYQTTHNGLVDFSFSLFFPQVVIYKPNKRPKTDNDLAWTPHTFNWNYHKGNQYDYFLIRFTRNLNNDLFPPNKVILKAHSGNWWLYERITTKP